MTRFQSITAFALFVLCCFLPIEGIAQGVSGFVTRSGSNLILNGKPFRFAGANLDNLALASDTYSQGSTDQYYPSEFAVDDAFATVEKMGGKVARIYSAGSEGFPLSIEPTLGHFNETALRQLDYVIKSAGDHGIRVELCLIIRQNFYLGGMSVFEKWRNGKSFYEEPVVSDFEEYIGTLLNRVNSFTHVAYKDDPTIFGWETDNEIHDSPVAWENRISSYIKKNDPHHLVINGNDSPDGSPNGIPEQDRLLEPNFDIFVRHYYRHWGMNWDLGRFSAALAKANKAFVVEEFGWDKTNFTVPELRQNLAELENNPLVAGDMFWALRAQEKPGVDFPVPGEGGEWWALYYHGINTSSNTAADMHERALILQDHAFKMSGTASPSESVGGSDSNH